LWHVRPDVDAGNAQPLPSADTPPASAKAFRFVRFSDLVMTEPEYLIEGLIEVGTLCIFVGDPGAGKSFCTVGAGASIATGTAFHGRETRPGTVFYIAGEGHSGLARRRAAWETETGISLEGRPFFVSEVAGNFLDPTVTASVIEAIKALARREGPPALIVVDTLARNFGAGDESKTPDMNIFVAAVDRVKGQWPGCAAIVVHHTGHQNKTRGRGSFALTGAADAEYLVEKQGMALTLTCIKMKDGAPPAPIGFDLIEVDLGAGRKGKRITSLVLRETGTVARRASRPLSAKVRTGLDSFKRALVAAGVDEYGWVHVEAWRPHFYAISTADNQSAKKVAFQRARADLVSGGHLTVNNEEYRYARLPD
jgi:hypothetical protein